MGFVWKFCIIEDIWVGKCGFVFLEMGLCFVYKDDSFYSFDLVFIFIKLGLVGF